VIRLPGGPPGCSHTWCERQGFDDPGECARAMDMAQPRIVRSAQVAMGLIGPDDPMMEREYGGCVVCHLEPGPWKDAEPRDEASDSADDDAVRDDAMGSPGGMGAVENGPDAASPGDVHVPAGMEVDA
jgi:hypothetical protein